MTTLRIQDDGGNGSRVAEGWLSAGAAIACLWKPKCVPAFAVNGPSAEYMLACIMAQGIVR